MELTSLQWSDSRVACCRWLYRWIHSTSQVAHTSLSRGEHIQTDRAFQLIKESVWVDLAAGCMGVGHLYYWWQWLHYFSMQDCFQNMACIFLIDRHTTLECMTRYMTIDLSIPCTHLNQSYGFSKHLYVRFSLCAAIFLLNTNWHLLQNIGGWISGQSLDTSTIPQ